MVLHAGRRIERPGVIRTTTLCGRMNARSRDGMNIAGTGQVVTCKFCLAKMRGPVPVATDRGTAAPVHPRRDAPNNDDGRRETNIEDGMPREGAK